MGAALETVTVQHERAKQPRQERISRNVKRAVDHMVLDGLHRRDAAKQAGLAEHSLYMALRKPAVLAYLNSQQGVLRTSAIARTVAKAEALMDGAESEAVQMKAIEYINPPVNRTESLHIHEHSVPGLSLTFNMMGAMPDPVQVIDGQSHEIANVRQISGLAERVPHPSERNADNPASTPPPIKAGGGAKS